METNKIQLAQHSDMFAKYTAKLSKESIPASMTIVDTSTNENADTFINNQQTPKETTNKYKKIGIAFILGLGVISIGMLFGKLSKIQQSLTVLTNKPQETLSEKGIREAINELKNKLNSISESITQNQNPKENELIETISKKLEALSTYLEKESDTTEKGQKEIKESLSEIITRIKSLFNKEKESLNITEQLSKLEEINKSLQASIDKLNNEATQAQHVPYYQTPESSREKITLPQYEIETYTIGDSTFEVTKQDGKLARSVKKDKKGKTIFTKTYSDETISDNAGKVLDLHTVITEIGEKEARCLEISSRKGSKQKTGRIYMINSETKETRDICKWHKKANGNDFFLLKVNGKNDKIYIDPNSTKLLYTTLGLPYDEICTLTYKKKGYTPISLSMPKSDVTKISEDGKNTLLYFNPKALKVLNTENG